MLTDTHILIMVQWIRVWSGALLSWMRGQPFAAFIIFYCFSIRFTPKRHNNFICHHPTCVSTGSSTLLLPALLLLLLTQKYEPTLLNKCANFESRYVSCAKDCRTTTTIVVVGQTERVGGWFE